MQNFPQLFPKNFVSIVAGGEKSGSLQESFDYLSKFYSKEIKNKTKQLPTVIEPILLIFIALVVGFIALSIITPIYKMTSSITR
jgi:type IV pilus assembly protein PilC